MLTVSPGFSTCGVSPLKQMRPTPDKQKSVCPTGWECHAVRAPGVNVTLNPGDTVNIPPDTMHWHGASPDRLFAHLALSEAGEQGQGAAWGEHVSDAEYNEPASGG